MIWIGIGQEMLVSAVTDVHVLLPEMEWHLKRSTRDEQLAVEASFAFELTAGHGIGTTTSSVSRLIIFKLL